MTLTLAAAARGPGLAARDSALRAPIVRIVVTPALDGGIAGARFRAARCFRDAMPDEIRGHRHRRRRPLTSFTLGWTSSDPAKLGSRGFPT